MERAVKVLGDIVYVVYFGGWILFGLAVFIYWLRGIFVQPLEDTIEKLLEDRKKTDELQKTQK